jgi:hypothetical protein
MLVLDLVVVGTVVTGAAVFTAIAMFMLIGTAVTILSDAFLLGHESIRVNIFVSALSENIR